MTSNFWDAVIKRRSHYALGKQAVTTDQSVMEVVQKAVLHAPSAFNSQSARIVVLFGEEHKKLWHLTKEVLQTVVPESAFAVTAAKIDDSFAAGYGTILFFEDQAIVEGLQARFAAYAENFPVWSQQSSAIVQYIIWTGLCAEGWGCSLQHYNPLIDQKVTETWSLSPAWRLVAQMPFGNVTAAPASKNFEELDERVVQFS